MTTEEKINQLITKQLDTLDTYERISANDVRLVAKQAYNLGIETAALYANVKRILPSGAIYEANLIEDNNDGKFEVSKDSILNLKI